MTILPVAPFKRGTLRAVSRVQWAKHLHVYITTVGDDETPATVGFVNVGGRVKKIAAGSLHTCAVLETGAVRCWGAVANGRLGYGSDVQSNVGDDEHPAEAGDVPLL